MSAEVAWAFIVGRGHQCQATNPIATKTDCLTETPHLPIPDLSLLSLFSLETNTHYPPTQAGTSLLQAVKAGRLSLHTHTSWPGTWWQLDSDCVELAS